MKARYGTLTWEDGSHVFFNIPLEHLESYRLPHHVPTACDALRFLTSLWPVDKTGTSGEYAKRHPANKAGCLLFPKPNSGTELEQANQKNDEDNQYD